MAQRTVRRVAVTAAFSWAAVFGGIRAFVAQPELCRDPGGPAIRTAVDEAVGWFARNQNTDGTWLYRYDKDADVDVGGYNIVRHAGVTMSLFQAATIGSPDALDTADRGLEWALERLDPAGDGVALSDGGQIKVGATGLLVAGMVERRELTGDPVHDEQLIALGRFLQSTVEVSGAVLAYWDTEADAPVPGQYSHYFTGEVGWALARLHRAFPDEGFGADALAVARYLTVRDEVEGRYPPTPDHWAAYTYGEIARWSPDGSDLGDAELEQVRRLAGLFGAQVRYESQRGEGWWTYVTRGRRTLGAGLGTLGEGLTGLWNVASTERGRSDDDLADERDDIAERALCVASLLVDRQIDATEAGDELDPDRARGAWFQFGVTQMDDQQHAMSALLRALPMTDDPAPPPGPTTDDEATDTEANGEATDTEDDP